MRKIILGMQGSRNPKEEESERTQDKNKQCLQRESNEEIMPNNILLYSQVSALVSHHHRHFLPQQILTNTKPPSQRERKNVEFREDGGYHENKVL